MKIVLATTPIDIEAVRRLFLNYATSLKVDLWYQGFEEELSSLPGQYVRPKGGLLLAVSSDGIPAGCVGIRPLDKEVAELKRLYVRPDFQGQGLGKRLVVSVLNDAQLKGYRRVRLDTLPKMTDAIRLYRSLGFREIAPYCHNPVAGARFLEVGLGDHSP